MQEPAEPRRAFKALLAGQHVVRVRSLAKAPNGRARNPRPDGAQDQGPADEETEGVDGTLPQVGAGSSQKGLGVGPTDSKKAAYSGE